jgi:hypothetical protein
VSIGAPGGERHNARHPQFGALLDCPLQAVELENRQRQRDLGRRSGFHFFVQLKLHPLFRN